MMRESDFKLMRYTLAVVWLVTGMLSLGIFPQTESLILLGRVGLHGVVAQLALYAGASLDLLFGVLSVIRPCAMLWRAQAALVITYSAIIACWLPEFWLHPFGPMLKNLPILLLLWLLHQKGNPQ